MLPFRWRYHENGPRGSYWALHLWGSAYSMGWVVPRSEGWAGQMLDLRGAEIIKLTRLVCWRPTPKEARVVVARQARSMLPTLWAWDAQVRLG